MGREERSLDEHEMKWLRCPGFGIDIGFARKEGRGSRGMNNEALDMAMAPAATIHALCAFWFYSPNLDVFVSR